MWVPGFYKKETKSLGYSSEGIDDMNYLKLYKGSVLISVLMITIAAMITLSGLFAVLQGNMSTTYDSINDSRLYYSAESGLNYGLKWIKTLGGEDFNSLNDGLNKTINDNISGIQTIVRITPVEDPDTGGNIWSVTSSSSKDGKVCEILNTNIKSYAPSENLLHHSFHINGAADWHQRYYIEPGVTHIGKYHASKFVAIYNYDNPSNDIKKTRFFGSVEMSSNFDSYFPNRYLDRYLLKRDANFSDVSKGLYLNSYNVRLRDKQQVRDELDNEIFPMGYTKQVEENDYDENISYNYNQLLANPGKIKTFNVANSGIPNTDYLEVKFKLKGNGGADSFGNDFPKGTPIMVVRSKKKRLHILQGEYNVVAIPEKYNNVQVKGVVFSDMTIATEKDDIYISGDIFSPEYSKYRRKSLNDYGIKDYDPNNEELEINKMRAIDTDIEIGIMAGIGFDSKPRLNEGNIYIDHRANKKKAGQSGGSGRFNTQAILINAALFSPNGVLLAEGADPNNRYSRSKIRQNFPTPNDVIIYGSFVGRDDGAMFSSWGGGLRPHYISDTNIIKGKLPKGFKKGGNSGSGVTTITNPATGEAEIKFTEEITWSINWQ